MAVKVGGIVFTIKVINKDGLRKIKAFSGGLTRSRKEAAKASKATNELSGSLNKLAGALTSVVAAFATAAVIDFSKESTLLAARVENLGTVLDNVGRIAGLNSAQIRNVEDSVKSLGITTQAARKSLTQLAQANLDLRRATELTRIAQDAAVIAGVDSSEAFNRLVVSIQRNDVRLLRNLGIVINLNTVYQKFAQQTGRTAQSLTAFEKRQLLLNEVIERGRLIQGTYEASLQDVFKRLTSMRRLVEEASVAFGKNFIPVLEIAVDVSSRFLKEFTAGRAEILGFTDVTPRLVAKLAIFAGALSAAAAGFAALATAAAGLVVAGGGFALFTAAIIAASVAVGALVANQADLKLAQGEARAAMKAAEEQGEQTTQAIFDQADAIQELRDQIEREGGGAGFSTENLQEARKSVAALAAAFPELRERILEVAKTDDFAGILEIFKVSLPEALLDLSKIAASFNERRAIAERQFRFELQRTFEVEEGITDARRNAQLLAERQFGRHAKFSLEGLKLRKASFNARQRVNVALARGTEEFIKQNPVLAQNSKQLKFLAGNVLTFSKAVRQAEQAKLTQTFQELAAGFDQLVEAGNIAQQEITRLQTRVARALKGTNAEFVRQFLETQKRIVATAITVAEQLKTVGDAQVAAQKLQSETIRDDKLEEAERSIKDVEALQQARENIEREFSKAQQRIEGDRIARVKAGQEALDKLAQARELSLEAITTRLNEQARANERLQDVLRQESQQVTPELIRLRTKLAEQTENVTKANDFLRKSIVRLSADITAALKEGATDRANDIREELTLTERALQQNFDRRTALDRLFTERFKKQIKERTEFFVKEQRRLQARLAELQEGEDIFTFEGISRAIDELDEGSQRVEDFLGDLTSTFADKTTPGLKKLDETFSRFAKNIDQATSQEQLERLGNLFPKVLKEQLDAADKSVKKLKSSLAEFREEERPAKERDQRIERQRRFNELVDAGVPAAVARAEVEKTRVQQADALNKKEQELQDQLKEQQQVQRTLKEEAKKAEEDLTNEIASQTNELQKQAELRARFNTLRDEEISKAKELLELNRQSQVVLQAQAQEGIAGRSVVPPAPAAATGEALRGLGEGQQAVATSSESLNEAIRANATQQQNLLASIRSDQEKTQSAVFEATLALASASEEAKENTQHFVRNIRRQSAAGEQVLKPRM